MQPMSEERIAALEGLLRRWADGMVKRYEMNGCRWIECRKCRATAKRRKADVVHLKNCIVGDTLKALEVDSDDDAE